MIYKCNGNEDKLRQKKFDKYKGKKRIFLYTLVTLLFSVFALFFNNIKIKVEIKSFQFTESARDLKNPNRGFYHLYTFLITDDQINYEELIKKLYKDDIDTELILVKICLQNYRKDIISEKGLKNIKKIFSTLEHLNKQLIVRFVYDDEGKIEYYEPETIDIILQHMKQLNPIISEYCKHIFIIQGLFTGNWGEMNGTRYNKAEDMECLANQLASITDEFTYLAVRTPGQWRSIIQSNNPVKVILEGNQLAARLSLFNDGLLGNRSDYGTYKIEDNDDNDSLGRWKREEELDFQERLCCYVPNGGEVINDNPYNDFTDAVKGLAKRHVTYLNKDYDQAVLKKWEREFVTEKSCFYGMDGYTYIDRHLGYRLLIEDTNLEYSKNQNCIFVEVCLKNVGFAPLYKKAKISMFLYNKEKSELFSKEMSCAVRELSGGGKSGLLRTAYAQISVNELSKSEYDIYFCVEDLDTKKHILLANEQDEEVYGYHIGTIKVY